MTQWLAWESHNLQVVGSNPTPATVLKPFFKIQKKFNMSKKTTISAPATPTSATASAVNTTTDKQPIQLTAMQLSALSFIVSSNYEKATEDERACAASFHESILKPLIDNKLIEIAEGEENRYVATKFGVKWVLKSTTFGINFKKLFSVQVTENTSTLHAALFALAEELGTIRHKETPIFYYEKDGKTPSKFYQKFLTALDDLDGCLQAAPEQE